MKFGIELLVVALAALQSIGFLLTYILAVYYGHVNPKIPYISDTGGKPPESCVFTLICSLSAIIVLVIMFIRFLHIHQYYKLSIAKVKSFNIVILCFGLLSVVGLLLVGAFQDDEVKSVHFVGAFMVFGFGIVYMWLQTILSYRIYHASLTRHISSVVILIRLVLCIIATLSFILVIVAMQIAGHQRIGQQSFYNSFYWNSRNAGFPLHLTSTISEWCLGISFLLYFLTFHTDFTRLSVIVSITLRHGYLSISESTPLTV